MKTKNPIYSAGRVWIVLHLDQYTKHYFHQIYTKDGFDTIINSCVLTATIKYNLINYHLKSWTPVIF